MQTFVEKVSDNVIRNPGSVSYDVEQSVRDSLITVKLGCCLSVAKQFQPFLEAYQTDRPMIPFLAADLFELLKICCNDM